MNTKPHTIKDVAELSEVSIATVSRVINNSGNVSDELRVRVNDAIEKLNYRPNIVAQSLKTNSTKTIAFVVSNIQDQYFTKICRSIEDFVEKDNYNIFVCSTDGSKKKELSYLKLLQEKKVDGIILNHSGYNEKYVVELSHKIPIVLINRNVENKDFIGDFIDNNNIKGVYNLTKLLIKENHKKIGIINGQINLSVGYERHLGFEKALKESNYNIGKLKKYIFNDTFTYQSGYNGAKRLLEMEDPPTAIIICNSDLTLGFLKYTHENNIYIPEDIVIACFGSIPNKDILYTQPITTNSNRYIIGQIAGEMILSRIKNNKIENRKTILETKIKK